MAAVRLAPPGHAVTLGWRDRDEPGRSLPSALKDRDAISETPGMDPLEMLAAEVYGDVAVTEVIRPAAVLPETAAA